jgi:hypothetical protein
MFNMFITWSQILQVCILQMRRQLQRVAPYLGGNAMLSTRSSPGESTRLKRVLSGIQPTGSLHLGNYIGKVVQFSCEIENNKII